MKKRIALKDLRGALSQEEFAKRLGVDQATVSRWEKKGVTKYAKLVIEKRLGVEVESAA